MQYTTTSKKAFFLLTLILCQIHLLFGQEIKNSNSSSFPYPIDIVYLWVDGSDPDWMSIKNHHLLTYQRLMNIPEEACSANRFFDHEELRYSLRSILLFAPFVNHIYIVTMNQHPKWLVDHPKITIIDHQEIFKNPRDLPTFNSQALECHLHRIPGLSEYFIYFNDDVFLGAPVTPHDFFTSEGKIKVLFEKGKTVSPNPEVQASLYRKAWVNSNELLDSHFIKETRHRLCHAPFALRKSFIEEAENLFPYVFSSNSSHKFRSVLDFNLTNGLLQYIWLYQGYIEKGNLTNKMFSLYSDTNFANVQIELSALEKKPLHTFCIQDCMTEESEKSSELLQNFFKLLYSDPAPWETVNTSHLNTAHTQ